jgi:predicted anti-sigma-YlaC factor YlaD
MSHTDKRNCRHMLESLSDFVNNELADEICSEINRHLEECPDCQIVVDTLRKTVYLYRTTAEPPPVPEDVRQRLYRRLNFEGYQGN